MISNLELLKKDLIVIEDISKFLITVPQLHPDNPQYTKLWTQYTKWCIEGYWVYDNKGWRFMPPTLFYYGNFFKIEDTDRNTKVRTFVKPTVRDLDWLIHYSYMEAQGFSGFKNDDKISCDEALINESFYKELELAEDPTSRIRFNDLHSKNGKKKQYEHPRQYLKRVHILEYGKPLYYNRSHNLTLLGSRGGGKSYSCAGIATHILTFDGIKEFTKQMYENPPTTKVILGAGITGKSAELVNKITSGLNVLGTDKDLGVWGDPATKDYEPTPFYRNWIGDDKPGNTKNPFRYEYELETPQGWLTKGTKTSLHHINYSDKKQDGTQAGAGGRSALCLYEEIGLMPNFKDALLSNSAVVSVEGEQVGVQLGIGTSGNIDLVQQTKQVFENPGEYNFLEFDNVWEQTDKKIGLFIPAYLTEKRFKDKNGNTDFERALKHYEERRLEASAKEDPASLYNEKMNYPLVPSDMWITNKGNYFPQIELFEREKELLRDQTYKTLSQPTRLIWDSKHPNGVRAEYDPDIELFYTFPYDRTITKLDGGIAIYEKPQTIRGETPNDMYLATFDPYVSENIDEGGSLGITKVFLNPKYTSQGFNGNYLVATYIGKHPKGKDAYYENQEKLLAYYGNPIRGLWYEANRGDSCRGYYMRKNKMYLLALRPNKEKGSQIFQNRVLEYGVTVGNQLDKIEMCDDTSDWLLSQTNYNGKKLRVVENYPCLFTVQQLIQFELKGNFDAVSALIIYPLALKELEHQFIKERVKPKHCPLAGLSMNPNRVKVSNTLDRIRQLNKQIEDET
mgnify:CR=1 FL=1